MLRILLGHAAREATDPRYMWRKRTERARAKERRHFQIGRGIAALERRLAP